MAAQCRSLNFDPSDNLEPLGATDYAGYIKMTLFLLNIYVAITATQI